MKILDLGALGDGITSTDDELADRLDKRS